MKELMFDDDTFTDDLPRAEAIARELGKLGVTWSCNAKANVPRDTLKVLKPTTALRLLLVGYESGNQQILHNIKKGMLIDVAKKFTKDCHELGITIHGTFIMGLPGETKDTIAGDDQVRDARSIRIPFRFRSPRLIPARSCTSRRWKTAGSTPPMPNSSMRTAFRSRRCIIPTISVTRKSSHRSTSSTGAFISASPKIASIVGEMVTQPRDDEAPPARGRRVLPLPQGAPRGVAGGVGRLRSFRPEPS